MTELETKIKEGMAEVEQMDRCVESLLTLPRFLRNALFNALDAVCAEADSKWGFPDGICLRPDVTVGYAGMIPSPYWHATVRVLLHIPDNNAGAQVDWRVVDDFATLEDGKDNARQLLDMLDGIRLRLDPGHGAKSVRDLIENNLRVLKNYASWKRPKD